VFSAPIRYLRGVTSAPLALRTPPPTLHDIMDNKSHPSTPDFRRAALVPPPGVRGPSRVSGGAWPFLICALSLIPIVYSAWSLWVVARDGDIGVNCVLGIEIKEEIPDEYAWEGGRPAAGDHLVRIGGRSIDHYPAFVEAKRMIRDRIGEPVEVEWSKADGTTGRAKATVRHRPFWAYFWSLLWLAPEMAILASRPGCSGSGRGMSRRCSFTGSAS